MLLLVAVFVAIQGLMYVYSFRAIGRQIGLATASALYLKRNLVSIFLPAGMLTNMFFFNEELERKGINHEFLVQEGVAHTTIGDPRLYQWINQQASQLERTAGGR